MTDFETNAITAAMAAAAGLGGFALVFLGVLIATLQSFGGATGKQVLKKYQRPAGLVLAAFVVCMISVAISFTWLITHSSEFLYWFAIAVFFIALGFILLMAVVVVRQLVWSK